MLHSPHQIQFFMSTDAECPYLEGKKERKLFTSLGAQDPDAVQNALSAQGFRRSQNIVYKPVCQDCAACLSARIIAGEFKASKNQKRILKRNQDIVREVRPAKATDEQFDLFERYVKTRHQGGGMSEMSLYEFASMIDETQVKTRVIEYRRLRDGRPAELIAVSLTDILDNGLSMVYSFFDPEISERSLGAFMILDHVELCAQAGLPFVYLGYWVKNSSNMEYKSRYQPLEIYYNGLWTRTDEFESFDEIDPRPASSQQILFKALRTLGKLPNTRKL